MCQLYLSCHTVTTCGDTCSELSGFPVIGYCDGEWTRLSFGLPCDNLNVKLVLLSAEALCLCTFGPTHTYTTRTKWDFVLYRANHTVAHKEKTLVLPSSSKHRSSSWRREQTLHKASPRSWATSQPAWALSMQSEPHWDHGEWTSWSLTGMVSMLYTIKCRGWFQTQKQITLYSEYSAILSHDTATEQHASAKKLCGCMVVVMMLSCSVLHQCMYLYVPI